MLCANYRDLPRVVNKATRPKSGKIYDDLKNQHSEEEDILFSQTVNGK